MTLPHQQGTTGKTICNMKPVFNFICFKQFPKNSMNVISGRTTGKVKQVEWRHQERQPGWSHHEVRSQVMPQARSSHGFRDYYPKQSREICPGAAWTAPAGYLTVEQSKVKALILPFHGWLVWKRHFPAPSNPVPEQMQLFSSKRLVSFICHRLLKSTRFSLECHHILNIYCITR